MTQESQNFHRRIAPGLCSWAIYIRFVEKFERVHPGRAGALNKVIEQSCDFRPSTRCISKTVKYRTYVTNSEINNFEWPWTAIAHSSALYMYRVCQKSDTLLVSEFSTLVRCIIFAIFVYFHIIFIKCLMSEPSVVSTDGLSSKMVYHHTLRKTR